MPLMVNQLNGFGVGRVGTPSGGPSGPTLTHTDATSSAGSVATYTFTGRSIGAAAGDRVVIVAVSTARSSAIGARTINSVTLTGNAMTPTNTPLQLGSQVTMGLFYLAFPTGTTADIVVTLSNSNAGCAIDVWSMTGQSSNTPFDAPLGGSASVAVDIDDGGCLAAVGGGCAGTLGDMAWTGATETSDTTIGGVYRQTAAAASLLSAETNRSVGITSTATNEGVLAASWV